MPPLVVDDWAALDAEIDEYIREGSAAHSTHDAYSQRWAMWEAHCEQENADPWNAPADVFMALWLRRNADGTPTSYNSIDGIASAVKHHYALKGLTPAYKLPAHIGTWRDLRIAAKKAQSRRTEDDEGKNVVPLMRSDVIAMMSTQPTWTDRQLVTKTAILLGLDGMAPGRIDKLRGDDVQLLDDGGVVLGGQEFPCDHMERVQGVPWDCTACAVRDALALLPDTDAPLLYVTRLGWTYHFPQQRARHRHLAAPKERWGPREGLSAWEMAGLRRGMVLHCASSSGTAHGLRWVRARALTAVSWACGLRMASDTVRLDRSALRPDADGRGWTLSLGVTKDDQTGSKSVTRAFPWDDMAAQPLAEFACVRDALTSPDGALFTSLTRGPATPVKAPGHLAAQDLKLLAELAGLDPVYSSYSTRKGYAAQAQADGWAPEDIRDGLRHLHLTTTVSHYLPGQDAHAVERRFVGRLGQDTDGGAAA